MYAKNKVKVNLQTTSHIISTHDSIPAQQKTPDCLWIAPGSIYTPLQILKIGSQLDTILKSSSSSNADFKVTIIDF